MSPAKGRINTGKMVALAAAASYGVNTTLSRLAYDSGTTPVSLTFFRYAMVALILILLVTVSRRSWRIPIKPLPYAGAVLGWFLVSIGHLGAVRYIPVSLSAIVFYTFPLQVVAWKRWYERKPVQRTELFAFLLAFVGLVLALGPEFHQVDWRGLAMAFSGSLGASLFLLCYERFPEDTDAIVTSTWITLGAVVLSASLFLLGFDLVPPVESAGWLYLSMIAVFSLVAFILTLIGIRMLDAASVSLYLNFEPVVILLLAWTVLHEVLEFSRIAGMSLVLMALFLAQKSPVKPS